MSPIGELYKTINTSPHLYEILVSCFYFKNSRLRPLDLAFGLDNIMLDEQVNLKQVPMKKAYLLVSFVLVYIHFGVG
jgi:hypothetical protein